MITGSSWLERAKGYVTMAFVGLMICAALSLPSLLLVVVFRNHIGSWSVAAGAGLIVLEIWLISRYEKKRQAKYSRGINYLPRTETNEGEDDDTEEPEKDNHVFVVFRCERADLCLGPCKNCPVYHDFHVLQKQIASANSKAQALERKGQLMIH